MKRELKLAMAALMLTAAGSKAMATSNEYEGPVSALLFTTTVPCIGLPLITMASQIDGKDLRQQAANDALLFITENESSDFLSKVLENIRTAKPELRQMSDHDLSKNLIKEVLQEQK